jgi:PUA-domain protein
MPKRQLSQKEIKDLAETAKGFSLEISKKDRIELLEDKHRIIFINGEAALFYHNGRLIPTLKFLQKKNTLKAVTVDMGAVKFVINGADIMRPGIRSCDSAIKKDEFVAIVDETHKKPLAIGIAMFSGEEVMAQRGGKVVKNIHWVGDEIWNY